ncbi:adenosylmethionine--8-amino-7-oxononanoate transaminase [Yunchengibacter salinarum]|uniref:adenosylmethionine--8-amino-7-oxononanoate transaminase n=1 Tax=Yunchengibacter salinarum TaxID=3133399 RepID=UPI0035B6385F
MVGQTFARAHTMTLPDWYESGMNHIWLPYSQMKTATPPFPVASTEGVRITLSDGRELIDGVSSWWAATHGYNHPRIIQAMQDQVATMPHVMFAGLVHEPAMRLATSLADMLPGDLNHAFFAESGSVSVEVAMKIALQSFFNRGERRTKFVHFRGSYHGDTLGTMAVCDPEEGMHSLFAGVVAENILADLPRTQEDADRFAEMLKARAGEVCAVITEPLVQGAGGMLFHDPQTLRWLRQACDAAGVLLIVDEIFTGFGRTGSLFAVEQAGIVPDVITLSKGLTGGTTPLSAAVARTEVFETFLGEDSSKALMHGPTYMAHPVGCAAALAALDLCREEDRPADARRIGAQMEAELSPLRDHSNVSDVRVKGAIAAVQLKNTSGMEAMRPKFVARGVWIRPFRNVLYLAPPLIIGEDDLTRLTGAIAAVIREDG